MNAKSAPSLYARAVHDPGGRVEAIVISPGDGPPVAAGPGGMLVTELDAMELGLDLSAESALEKLAELVPKFRITPAGRGRMERTP